MAAQEPGIELTPGAVASAGAHAEIHVQDRDVRLPDGLLGVEGPYVLVHLAESGSSSWRRAGPSGRLPRGPEPDSAWTAPPSTPRRLFKVRRKEKDLLWEAPAWFYAEQGLTVPADNDPARDLHHRVGVGTPALVF